MAIALSTILGIANPADYKVHLACWNGSDQPLDVFVRDREEWRDWNTWRSAKDEFNRPFILSFAQFYPEPNMWLFGGIYQVLGRSPVNHSHSYVIELTPQHQDLIGRLMVVLPRPGRARSIKLESYYASMTVAQLLKEPYVGERFPGYEDICHDFGTMEVIFRTNRADWKAALENVKGVYVIADRKNGKKYVGAAYGDAGLWARWSSYMQTGHGWSDELTSLIDREGIDYARQNFRISLLEYRPAKTDDTFVIARENYWKEALLSRVPLGYNKN